MKIEELSEDLIGKRVRGIENGYVVTGVIKSLYEEEFEVGVVIELDEPLHCWSGDFNIETWIETEYRSWARKEDGWGNLQHTELI